MLVWFLIGFGVVLGILLAYLLVWAMIVPWNKAKVLRIVTRKNWGVVMLRKAGGQLSFSTVLLESPLIELQGKTFELKEEYAHYKGSVPLYSFNFDDSAGIDLRGKRSEEFFRDPKHLNAAMMLMKALYESLGLKNVKLMQLLLYASVACGVGALIGLYFVFQEVSATRVLVADLVARNMSMVLRSMA